MVKNSIISFKVSLHTTPRTATIQLKMSYYSNILINTKYHEIQSMRFNDRDLIYIYYTHRHNAIDQILAVPSVRFVSHSSTSSTLLRDSQIPESSWTLVICPCSRPVSSSPAAYFPESPWIPSLWYSTSLAGTTKASTASTSGFSSRAYPLGSLTILCRESYYPGVTPS